MSEFDDLPPELQSTWDFVARSNDQALVALYKDGDIKTALAEFDRIRDIAIEMASGHPDIQNEIECRRLEFRVLAAFHVKDYGLICQTLQEAGKSRRFSSERIYFNLDVVGGLIRDLGKVTK